MYSLDFEEFLWAYGYGEDAIDSLFDAGMIQRVLNVSTPQLPLAGYEQKDQFKIYATDIGLATAMFGFQTQTALVSDKLPGPAKGGRHLH